MKNGRIRRLAIGGMMTALMAALSMVAVPLPFSPVPVSLAVAGVLLCGGVLPPVTAALSMGAYLLLGAVGLPVYAGMQAGAGVLVGPTGGFLLAYPAMAVLVSLCVRAAGSAQRIARFLLSLAGMVGAVALCYGMGSLWFAFQQKVSLMAALAACVVPFVPADAIKIALCLPLLLMLRRRVPAIRRLHQRA